MNDLLKRTSLILSGVIGGALILVFALSPKQAFASAFEFFYAGSLTSSVGTRIQYNTPFDLSYTLETTGRFAEYRNIYWRSAGSPDSWVSMSGPNNGCQSSGFVDGVITEVCHVFSTSTIGSDIVIRATTNDCLPETFMYTPDVNNCGDIIEMNATIVQ